MQRKRSNMYSSAKNGLCSPIDLHTKFRNTELNRLMRKLVISLFVMGILSTRFIENVIADDFQKLKYNNPELIVDLGVGLWAWPLPMDYDGDGDLDLLVACPDKPSNGVYFFENPGGQNKMPVFKPGVRLGNAQRYMHLSYVDGQPRILIPGHEFVDFRKSGFKKPTPIYNTDKIHSQKSKRAQNWNYVDYDGDGDSDLIIGIGDWSDYGWDNAYDSRGVWENGRLHGYVYLVRNLGTTKKPNYDNPVRIKAGKSDIDVYGWPSPNFADFDNDGDLDLICGEFLDSFTYFENRGSRNKPKYSIGKKLTYRGKSLTMDLQMIVPVAIDWDQDGDIDLVVGQEDGRIALVENRGLIIEGSPQFLPPKFFQQESDYVKFGVDSTPVSFDWDGDGDQDILCGNSAGYIGFIQNLGGGASPIWDSPKYLDADGEIIRITVGENGSIQGPCEAKWGQTVLSVADWNHDGLPDLIVNSMWGEILWYQNIGQRRKPELAMAKPVEVAWNGLPPKPRWNWWDPTGKQLVTQWRTTPVVIDFTKDGLKDLVMLDHEGYLALYERRIKDEQFQLLPPQRIFINEDNQPIQLNKNTIGSSGRRKIDFIDWDLDGRIDLLVDATNVDWWRNCETRDGKIVLKKIGPLGKHELAKHSTSPTTVDWDRNGKPDLLLGAEDGFFYHLKHNKAITYGKKQKKIRTQRDVADNELQTHSAIINIENIFTDISFVYCNGLTLVDTNAGIVAACSGRIHKKADQNNIWIGRFKGEWTDSVEVANGLQFNDRKYPCWDPALVQKSGGSLMLFYQVGSDQQNAWTELILSSDSGRIWKHLRRLPDGIHGPTGHNSIVFSDGSMISVSRSMTDNEKLQIETSSDYGTRWYRNNHMLIGNKSNNINPMILQHNNGHLQVIYGGEGRQFLTKWSTDRGKQWTKSIPLKLPKTISVVGALNSDNGEQLLVYLSSSDKLSNSEKQNIYFAHSDDGLNWQETFNFQEESDKEITNFTLIKDVKGLLHLAYIVDHRYIKHVILDPQLFKK